MSDLKRLLTSRASAIVLAGGVALIAAGGYTMAQNAPAGGNQQQGQSAQQPAPQGQGAQGQGAQGQGAQGGDRSADQAASNRQNRVPPRLARMCERDPLRFEGVARAFLRAELDLNSQQTSELEKLANAVLPALRDVRAEVCASFGQPNTLTPPDRLEKVAGILRKAAAAAETAVEPARSFYNSLDASQKARIDQLHERRMMRGDWGGRGGHGHHHGWGDRGERGGWGDRGDRGERGGWGDRGRWGDHGGYGGRGPEERRGYDDRRGEGYGWRDRYDRWRGGDDRGGEGYGWRDRYDRWREGGRDR